MSQLIAAGDIDVVPGHPPVPIAVWRVAAVDAPYGHGLADGLTPRMAALLIGAYTRPGDTIVSLGHDVALAGAAGGGGRRYRHVERASDLVGLQQVAGTVRLIVLAWPASSRTDVAPAVQPVELFAACRRLMAADGCTIVVLAAADPVDAYTDQSRVILPAARHAGLGWLQHIVAITAPITGERITWRAAPTDRASLRAAAHVTIHLDLLVLVPRRPHHG